MAEGNSTKDIKAEVNPGGSADEYSIFGANVPSNCFVLFLLLLLQDVLRNL